jgi:hypothetical protein
MRAIAAMGRSYSDINTKLNSSSEILDQNILNIGVLNELINVGWCFFFHTLDAATKRLQLQAAGYRDI